MNIAIIGYGKMGKTIAELARNKGHQIGLIIDLENAADLTDKNLEEIDVAIEFSSPVAAVKNIEICLRSGTPVVSGTTGWLDRWEEITKLCDKHQSGIFYTSNFSIGVNIMFALNKKLAEMMRPFPAYDVSIEEIHHIHKLDAPSGTAITLAEGLLEQLKEKKQWTLDRPEDDEIHVNARREGEVTGFHSVIYDSEIDTLTISHNAKSRQGFAIGAILAAEYMEGKTGIHSMKELLKL